MAVCSVWLCVVCLLCVSTFIYCCTCSYHFRLSVMSDKVNFTSRPIDEWSDIDLWDWFERFYYVEELKKELWKGTGGGTMIELCTQEGSTSADGDLVKKYQVPINLVCRLVKDFEKLLKEEAAAKAAAAEEVAQN